MVERWMRATLRLEPSTDDMNASGGRSPTATIARSMTAQLSGARRVKNTRRPGVGITCAMRDA